MVNSITWLLTVMGWTAFGLRLGKHLMPEADPLVCHVASCVLGWSCAVAASLALLSIGCFSLPWMALVAGCIAIPVLVCIRVKETKQVPPGGGRPARWVYILFLLSFVPSLLLVFRAFLTPPRAWDSLTYHLVKPAEWIQSGSYRLQPAPDAWGYYAHFPMVGDLTWAWTFLAGQGDGLLVIGYLAIGLIWPMAVIAVARELGSDWDASLLAGAAANLCPAVVHFAASAYVDTAYAAWTTVGTLFLLRAYREARLANVLLSSSALALAAATKEPGIGLWLIGMIWTLWCGNPHGNSHGRARTATFFAYLLPGVLWWLPRLWIYLDTGSWTYPLSIPSLGDWGRGSELLAATLRGNYPPMVSNFGSFLWNLFVGAGYPFAPHLNLGAGALLIVALALPTWFQAMRSDSRRRQNLLVIILAGFTVVAMISPSLGALRTFWSGVSGRFFLPAFALMAASTAAGIHRRAVVECFASAFLLTLPQAWPQEISLNEIAAASPLWGTFSVMAVISGMTFYKWMGLSTSSGTSWMHKIAPLILAISLMGLALGLFQQWQLKLRRLHRGESYANLLDSARKNYDIHALDCSPEAQRIWEWVERSGPLRLAFSMGWDMKNGHRWYRYPLYGSALQNRVLYVPPTQDGHIRDQWKGEVSLDDRDYDAFVARLRAQKVDALVFAAPLPAEAKLMLKDHRFDSLFWTPGKSYCVIRIEGR